MDQTLLKEKVDSKLHEIGYELSSYSEKFENGVKVVSIIVDRVEPVSMEDIVEVSRVLNEYFDELDPFDKEYTLDISSYGIEKPLKIENLSKYIGKYINVHIINPIDGENIYEGELSEVNDDSIKVSFKIKTRTKIVDIKKTNISNIRLAIKF